MKVYTMAFSPILFCLIMTLAVGIMATDLYVPCMALMKLAFSTSEATVQQTISVALMGAALASLLAGPMAEYWGKQRVLSGSLILFIVAGALSPMALTIELLTCLRFIQGIAIGVCPVIILAFLTETYHGKKLTQVVSLVGVVLTITLSCSPLLGGWIANVWGWKGCFWAPTVVMTVLLGLLKGKLPSSTSQIPFSKASFSRGIKNLFTSRPLLLYTTLHGVGFAAALTVRSTLSHYCADVLHFTPFEFGQFLSASMIANTGAGLFVSVLALRWENHTLLKIGVSIGFTTSLLYLAISYVCPLWPPALLSVMMLQNISIPLCFTPTLTLAAQQPGLPSGITSSFIIAGRNVMASMALYVGGCLYTPSLWSITLPFFILMLLSVALYRRVIQLKKELSQEKHEG